MKVLSSLGCISCYAVLLAVSGCGQPSDPPAPAAPAASENVNVLETHIQSLEAADDALAANDTVDTRFGKLEIVRSSADAPPDSLLLNDAEVFRETDFYLSLHRYIRQNARDLILFGSNCGGSGCPQNQFYFLILEKGSPPEVVTRGDFFAYPDELELTTEGERLILDLGFEAGKRKTASLLGRTLDITLETVPKSFIGEDYCQWLHTDALLACVDYHETDPNCVDPQADFSGYLTRGISALGEHPGFVAEAFDKHCKTACSTSKPTDYSTFAREVCSAGLR